MIGTMKKIRYALETAFLHTMFFISQQVGLDRASAVGGWIGRTIGPWLGGSANALDNLRHALPGKTEAEYRAIVYGMWDNLGRVMAEYPHLKQIGLERVEIVRKDIIDDLVQSEKPAVLFTGHLANWEALVAGAQIQAGMSMDVVYRAPNNPGVDRLLNRVRSQQGEIVTIPKSKNSVRPMVESLKKGRYMGMLIDQKYNEGLAVPFFGRLAMTSPAYVQLAQKFDCALIPGQIERLGGAHFRITVYPTLSIWEADGSPRPAEAIMEDAHHCLESWIRQRPEQWLWLHRRWNSAKLADISAEKSRKYA